MAKAVRASDVNKNMGFGLEADEFNWNRKCRRIQKCKTPRKRRVRESEGERTVCVVELDKKKLEKPDDKTIRFSID